MTAQLEDLHARANEHHVVVVGAGVGGLVAAYECAKVGMRVTVLEAQERAGGVVRSDEVAGLRLDLGAESFATRGGHVRALVDELGLGDDVVAPGTGAGGAWVAGVPGIGAAPLPSGGVLGIPASPFAEDVRRIIGWGGAWRAYLDRVNPVLTIGHEHSLGRLVRRRLGPKVLDRLVAPVTTGVYSALPDDIDPDIAAPGLNAAITRTGSLTGAVSELAGARRSAPGGAALGIRGGMGRLVEALVERLEVLGGEVRTSSPVELVERTDDGWAVHLAADPDAEETGGADGAPSPIAADILIVAVEEGEARRLISSHAEGLARDPERPGPVVELVTLVLDADALDAAPRGTGVLTVPGSHTAKALTHSTAKWQWVADAAGPHRHVVRISFGTQSEAPATEALTEAEAVGLALSEASALLGVPLGPTQLVGARRERFTQAQPVATAGLAETTTRAREALRTVPALGVVGAWLAGTGLAQVVPDAIAEADRVRRSVLFD